MANRLWTQFRYSFIKQPVDVFARVTIGSTGAPTLDATNSKGVKSITRVSAGIYTITFGSVYQTDTYNRLVSASCVSNTSAVGTNTAPAATGFAVFDDAVATAGTVRVGTLAPAGTVLDPASGEVLLFTFTFNNSSVN